MEQSTTNVTASPTRTRKRKTVKNKKTEYAYFDNEGLIKRVADHLTNFTVGMKKEGLENLAKQLGLTSVMRIYHMRSGNYKSIYGPQLLVGLQKFTGLDIMYALTGVKSAPPAATIKEENLISIPLYSPRVNAGRGVQLYGVAERTLNVMKSKFDPRKAFAVEVSGDSMLGDGICDDDIVICERVNGSFETAVDSIVIVTLDGVTLLKRLRERGSGLDKVYVLESSNTAYPDIVITNDSACKLEGIVRTLSRDVY